MSGCGGLCTEQHSDLHRHTARTPHLSQVVKGGIRLSPDPGQQQAVAVEGAHAVPPALNAGIAAGVQLAAEQAHRDDAKVDEGNYSCTRTAASGTSSMLAELRWTSPGVLAPPKK